MKEPVIIRSYLLRTESGSWLGRVIITSDGVLASVTDWGNLSFAWGAHGEGDFRKFLLDIHPEYFGRKMYQGIAYIAHGRKIEKACEVYADKILPALQKALKKELEEESK